MQKEYEHCIRCGRKLKSKKTRLQGMGEVCRKKYEIELSARLFDPIKSNLQK